MYQQSSAGGWELGKNFTLWGESITHAGNAIGFWVFFLDRLLRLKKIELKDFWKHF